MAAIADTSLVTITVNDREIQVPKGELIVESVKRLGLEIPIFCYHPRMKPVGMCRMCLVEIGFKQADGSVRKMPKPQAGCTLPASEGMVVYTDTEMVHRDRKGVLELLLINHPLDCPICDRGGECPLQNNTLFYGPSTSRFVEMKRHLPKAFPLSEYVTLDLERCIQCGRCVRFTEEISGDSELAFRFRGAQMTPSTFELKRFTSKFSGNVIEICPVGALTSSKYRFRARPWDLETRPAICTLCSNGCNIWFDYRVQKLVRVNGRTNDAVNEEWTCDKGKFGHDFYNSENRLTRVLLRDGDSLKPRDWAASHARIAEAFLGKKVAGLAGPMVSNEGLYAFQKAFRGLFGSNNVDHRWTRHLASGLPQPKPIASLEGAKTILVFGTSLADDLPMVYLRVRKAWAKFGAQVVVAHHEATDVDGFASHALRYRSGSEASLAEALATGSGLAAAAAATGVTVEAMEAVRKLLAEGAAVVASQALLNTEHGDRAVAALAGMGASIYALGANETGADALGVRPDAQPEGEQGLNTHQILSAAANGELDALWLMGCDPFALHGDRDLVTRALEKVSFLVVQDTVRSEATEYASVVVPMSAPAEMDGTYANCEGRVQRMHAILPAKGDAEPAWKALEEMSLRVKPRTPLFNAREVMDEIARTVPAFAGCRYERLDSEGVLLTAPD